MRIRCGAAAVIGEASELQHHCERFSAKRLWEGCSEAAMSRKPEDLPAEGRFRCFGHKHPSGIGAVHLHGPMPLSEG